MGILLIMTCQVDLEENPSLTNDKPGWEIEESKTFVQKKREKLLCCKMNYSLKTTVSQPRLQTGGPMNL